MLTLIPGLPPTVLGFEADGKVTAKDYEQLVVPAFEAAQAASPNGKVRVLCVLRDGVPDYTAGASWEDAKVGLGHIRAWDRIAVVSDADWLRKSLRAFSWMLPCEVQVFALDDFDGALAWITATD